MVYWITGLAGAGKTTIGEKLFALLKREFPNSVFLDGDTLREIIGNDLTYTQSHRLESSRRNARLCKLLSSQGIHVVCSTICMYREVRNWNRLSIPDYVEIFLDVPMDLLHARDQKGLYSGAKRDSQSDMPGIDVPYELPENPDLTVMNDGRETPDAIAARIYSQFKPSATA